MSAKRADWGLAGWALSDGKDEVTTQRRSFLEKKEGSGATSEQQATSGTWACDAGADAIVDGRGGSSPSDSQGWGFGGNTV